MKIWVIGRGYPTPANKMWGSFELEQAKLLARNGHRVSYIALTLSFFDRKDPRGFRAFEEDGVSVFAYSHFYFPGKAGIYLEKFEDSCWRKLFDEAEKKSGKPEVIHVHYPSMISSINETEKYRGEGVRIYVTEHWSRVLINSLKPHELARLKYYASHANCFACVSEPLQEAVKKLTDVTVPMKVIPNIVSPYFFNIMQREKKTDVFTFLCIGRLVPLKQFDAVIRQFISSFSGNKDIKLILIGSGSEKANLMHAAEGYPQISFTGELGIKSVSNYLADADVLVSFSKYETFAAPVAEAWAAGKPVIVSDHSGIVSYVNNELGIIVPADSEEKLGMAMKCIYKTYNQYNSGKIKEFASKSFSDDSIMQELTEMYTTN